MLSNLITLLKRFMGFPEPATEEQKKEKLITQRESRDCNNENCKCPLCRK